MNGNFLKKVPVAFVALAASTSVFAISDTDARLQQLEQQMKQVRVETAAGNYGAKTAPARPEVDGAGAYIILDALLWKANIGGTDYAYTSETVAAAYPIAGQVQSTDFDWDWGLKAGIGYNFEHDEWEGQLLFTYFKTSETNSRALDGGGSIIPLKGSADLSGLDLDFCNRAVSRSKLTYYNLDLDIGRDFFLSKYLSVKTSFGIRNSWFNLKQNVQYSGGLILGPDLTKNIDSSKVWGIGPSTSFYTNWNFCKGISIFANTSGSLLWSYFKVDHDESNSASTDDLIELTANMHRFMPMVQFTLGLAYQAYLNENKQHIEISLGWDTIYYWRANQFMQVSDFATKKYTRVSEDVSLQGVTLNIRLDF